MRVCSRLLSLDDDGSVMKIKISKFSFSLEQHYTFFGELGAAHTILLTKKTGLFQSNEVGPVQVNPCASAFAGCQ